MKRKVLLFGLAVAVLFTCAIPVSAYSVSMNRYWGDFYYATNDTARSRNFHCVIESDSVDYSICTNVEVHANGICQEIQYGSPNYLISTTSGSVGYAYHHIKCIHIIDGNKASSEQVYPS